MSFNLLSRSCKKESVTCRHINRIRDFRRRYYALRHVNSWTCEYYVFFWSLSRYCSYESHRTVLLSLPSHAVPPSLYLSLFHFLKSLCQGCMCSDVAVYGGADWLSDETIIVTTFAGNTLNTSTYVLNLAATGIRRICLEETCWRCSHVFNNSL